MKEEPKMPLTVDNPVELKLRTLNTLCVKGLAPMFDEPGQLFCNRLVRTHKGLEREGLSPRYTLMTLLGLHRGEKFGLRNPFDSGAILNGLIKERRWLDNIGDLGLLLWTCALMAPDRYAEVYRDFNAAAARDRFRDARDGHTMELSWFLAGLAHGALAGQKSLPGLADLAGVTFEVIRKNQGRNGIFGHLAGGAGVTGAFRGRLGSFADQVYPLYAFSKFAKACDHPEALKSAQSCAETICAAQGPLGQWWWHYDSRSGRVVGEYPVYSVHQDAMGPLALFALGESDGKDYSQWIFKGLPWIYGENELKFSLFDASQNIIWRCIFLSKSATYIREAASLMGFRPQSKTPGGLQVRYECRPYHLGWALYAFSQYGFE